MVIPSGSGDEEERRRGGDTLGEEEDLLGIEASDHFVLTENRLETHYCALGGSGHRLRTASAQSWTSLSSWASDLDLLQRKRNLTEEEKIQLEKRRQARVVVLASCGVASLTSILLGYDVGVVSAAAPLMRADLHLSVWELGAIVSSLNLMAAPGGLIAGWVADHYGRKHAIGIACVIFIVGALMQVLSFSFEALLAARIATGIGVGCGFVVSPVLITEITPPKIRGKMTAFMDIAINTGIVLGYIVGYLIANSELPTDGDMWRLMIGISIVPPIFILLALFALPESPRWLMGQGRSEEAHNILLRIVGDENQVQKNMKELREMIDVEKSSVKWLTLLFSKDRAVRLPLMLGLGLGIAQQISGSESAVYYSPMVLVEAGFEGRNVVLGVNILVGVCKLGGEVVAAALTDRMGRRPLLLWSSILCTVSLVFVAGTISLPISPWVCLFGLCAFMFCFSLGMGSLSFVVASEIFPLRLRGKGVALTVFVNRLMSGFIALVFPSMADALGEDGAFLLFAFLSAGTVVFYFYQVPETRRKSLEQITRELLGDSQPKKRKGKGATENTGLLSAEKERERAHAEAFRESSGGITSL